ncbi:hypothetical protein PsorP6_010537 [Peronosclerospora sorghi]|uniref:Uncharacterized protein n=1 Tax=Peronosclerospora sorghi TaxID=230839 RepID=A0ACC0VV16_9STRA|nr:hypothetical protein PsorP6_010537 [Peronosclerospora sorghi]
MEPNGGNSEAICLAQASDWKSLQRLLNRDPALEKERGDHAMLPIHWAYTVRRVPLSLIVKLVQIRAYPEAVTERTPDGVSVLEMAQDLGVDTERFKVLYRAYERGRASEKRDVDVRERRSGRRAHMRREWTRRRGSV